MLSTTRAIRRAADEIEAEDGRARFRRRRALDRSPAAELLVLSAVARARTGDADALRFLYLRYADNVYGYVCSIVRDEHEAEDVTQHIFAKLMTSLERPATAASQRARTSETQYLACDLTPGACRSRSRG